MSVFAGTGRLIRLALRRDRIKLPIWILAVFCFMALTVPALAETYPSAREREAYAVAINSGAVGKLFAGNMDDTSLGAIVTAETLIYAGLIVAFLNVLLIVRHTRQNEELGSSELIGSARVGRLAGLSAALLLSLAANSIVAVGVAGILLMNDQLPTSGAWLYGIGLGLIGLSFAAIAGVTTQLSGAARGASSLAALVIGATFLLRGIGDVFAQTIDEKVWPLWTSWLSPFGLMQLTRPLTLQEWWPLFILGGVVVVTVGISYLLLSRRDVGLGLFAARKGPARASVLLRKPFGLALHLQRGVLIGWLLTIAVLSLTVGAMAEQARDLLEESEVVQLYLAAQGGGQNIIEIFMSAMLAMIGLITAAYTIQSLQRLRSEEAGGRLESLLGTSLGRTRWVLSHVVIVIIGTALIMAACGITLAVSAGLAAGQPFDSWQLDDFIVGALSYVPALLVFVGLCVFAFGWLPKIAILLSWLSFGFVLIVSQLGELLKFPEWVMDISPFAHLANVPSDPVTAAPLIVLGVIGLGLTLVGLLGFRLRNLSTN